MKPKLILCLVLFISILPVVLRADIGMFDSVEWMTALADQIGVYHAERVYGPHSVTNSRGSWTSGCYTTDFKLSKTLRGYPPPSFSRSLSVSEQDILGFHAGDNYIFFFTDAQFAPEGDFSRKDDLFNTWDFLWLDRPQGGAIDGFAIDHHKGKILTGQSVILKLVEDSLNLPRANSGISHSSYLNFNNTNSAAFNFRVVMLPTPYTSLEKEHRIHMIIYSDWNGLVIPQCLYKDYLPGTNKLVSPAARH